MVKNPPAGAGDMRGMGSLLGLERSPGKGNSNPLQYSCPGNPMDRDMSLLFNMLSRLVITFLPRSKHLNFMAAVTICSDFGAPKNIKSLTVSTVSPSTCHEVMGPDAMILVF